MSTSVKAAEAAEIASLLECRAPAEASIAGLCEAFFAVEERHGLVQWKVHGMHPWPLVRMQLYYSLTRKLRLFEAAHPALKKHYKPPSIRRRLGCLAWFLARGLRPAAKGDGAWRPAALMMATRRVNGSEPYTDALRAELGPDALLLDRPHVEGEMRGALDIDSLRWTFNRLYGRYETQVFPQEARRMCHRVRCDIIERVGVDPGDLARQCVSQLRSFQPIRDGARDLFQARGIRTFFTTYGYGRASQALIEGARLAGARTVELQHGFISRYHLGYSWPGQRHVPHMPDELWLFGRYWAETTPLPEDVATVVIGAPYIARMAAENRQQRNPRQVIFNSQGVIGKLLFGMAVETARLRPDLTVIFRLHPSESLDSYTALQARDGAAPGNFSISHRTPNIFALQAASGTQVGAFSTTLMEGMALGTRTVVVDLPGVEYMRGALERGDAILVKTVAELVARIDDAPVASDPHVYYAPPVSRLLEETRTGAQS